MEFRSRVKEIREVPASQLKPHPKNFRLHPKTQSIALKRMIEEIGFIDPVLAVEGEDGSLMIIDGHLRTGIAENQTIPVVILDLNSEEADKALGTLDPIAEMARVNKQALESLITSVTLPVELIDDLKKRGDLVRKQLADGIPVVKTDSQIVKSGDWAGFGKSAAEDDPNAQNADAAAEMAFLNYKTGEAYEPVKVMKKESLEDMEDADDSQQVYMMTPDVVFKSDLMFGIPALRSDRLATLPSYDIKTFSGADTTWQEVDHPNKMWIYIYKSAGVREVPKDRGIVCFYTDDTAFAQLWNDPVTYTKRMIDAGFKYVMSPNFSLWGNWPEALWIYQIYRARWLGRFFQEAGLQVIPDVDFGVGKNIDLEKHIDLFACGLPRHAPVVSMQLQAIRDGDFEQVKQGVSMVYDRLEPDKFIFYGSIKRMTTLLGDFSWFQEKAVLVNSWSQERITERYARSDRHSLNSQDSYQYHELNRDNVGELEELTFGEA